MPHVTDRDASWAHTVDQPAPSDRRKAARTVAAHATDAADCRALLNMLGLHPQEGLAGADY